jgi:hypothetical protein
MASLSEILFGKSESFDKLSTKTPEQEQLISMLLGGSQEGGSEALQYLINLLGGDLSAFEEPAMRQFQQEIIPGIAERFSGINAQGSSAFQNALGGAGADLASTLAQLRAQLQGEAADKFLGLGQNLTSQQTFENLYRPASKGLVQSGVESFAKSAGSSFNPMANIAELFKK